MVRTLLPSLLLTGLCSACVVPIDTDEPTTSDTTDDVGPGDGDSTTDDNGSGGRAGSGSGGQSGQDSCTNVRPTGTDWDEATCDEWASDTTECAEDWMVDNNYCNESCGRCDPDASGSGGSSGSTGGSNGGGDHGKFVGNITTQDQVDTDGKTFSNHWDQITPENAGKWGSVQGTPGGGFNWGTLDAIYDYSEEKGIIFKQHAFVWGSQQPSGVPTQDQVINWIQSFCERYPNTKLIDVVNEPPPHTDPNYTNNIGGGTNGDWAWITNSFKWAREHCPGAVLILNDFNNIEWPNDNQHFIDIANTVLESGGPIDALGAQSHDLDHAQMTSQQVSNLLNKLHDDTGLPVYITEMDLDYTDDQQQLKAYQTYFPMFRDAEFVPGITIWGWIYGKTWSSAPNSGLIRNGQPRAALTWLMDELGRPVP